MPLQPDRFKALREAKSLSQGALAELSEVGQSTITKLEGGAAPNLGADILERIAIALDATTDYFFGRGFEEVDAKVAAAHMSFDVFAKDGKFNSEQVERCRRVLSHREAPKTALAWRSFAEMLDIAVGPTSSPRSSSLALVREKRPKSKA